MAWAAFELHARRLRSPFSVSANGTRAANGDDDRHLRPPRVVAAMFVMVPCRLMP